MAYNKDTFLKPISNDDKNLLIYDDSGKLVHTINPFSITNIQVRANIITINVKSQRTVILDFLNPTIAKDVIPILQQRIFTLTEKVPNFIDKQIENWLIGQGLSFSSGPQGPIGPTGGYIIESNPSFYGTVSIFGTMSMDGNIVPSLDYTWNLGSPTHRWNNIYVKDALIASQSLYFGNAKISVDDNGMSMPTHILPEENLSFDIGNTSSSWRDLHIDSIYGTNDINLPEGKHLYSGGLRFSNRITGTSEDLLTVATQGVYFEISTQKYLSFQRGMSVIVSNGLEDFYVDDDYYDDATAAVMISIVDSYNESTGLMGLYVEKPIGIGRTASNWTINISGRQATLELGATASFQELQITGISRFQSVIERLNSSTQSSNITYDFLLGNIWYHDDLSTDFSADFVNVPSDSNVTITSNIIISQSGTAYLPTSVTINGSSQTIKWVGGTPPTGNPNQVDVVGFSFINFGGTFVQTLAQLSSFA